MLVDFLPEGDNKLVYKQQHAASSLTHLPLHLSRSQVAAAVASRHRAHTANEVTADNDIIIQLSASQQRFFSLEIVTEEQTAAMFFYYQKICHNEKARA